MQQQSHNWITFTGVRYTHLPKNKYITRFYNAQSKHKRYKHMAYWVVHMKNRNLHMMLCLRQKGIIWKKLTFLVFNFMNNLISWKVSLFSKRYMCTIVIHRDVYILYFTNKIYIMYHLQELHYLYPSEYVCNLGLPFIFMYFFELYFLWDYNSKIFFCDFFKNIS